MRQARKSVMADSKSGHQNFINHLEEIPSRSSVCLYGAGEVGEIVRGILDAKRSDIKVLCYLDDAKTGEKDGLPILSITDLNKSTYDPDFILVASTYWVGIERKLMKAHITNYMIINPCLYYEHLVFSDQEIEKYRHLLDKVEGLLDHEEDRKIFKLLYETKRVDPVRAYELYDYYSSSKRQYHEFLQKAAITTILEGGVYDGADTADFVKFMPANGKLYGFEPYYEVLEKSKHGKSLLSMSCVKMYPLALWQCTTKLFLLEDPSVGPRSRILESNNEQNFLRSVDCISIDEFVQREGIRKVDFIKLDIEGAELEALKGGKNTLMTHRPQLAICTYHKKEHMFEIPLFISDVLDGYVFRIGHYTPAFAETVWYAIPREIV